MLHNTLECIIFENGSIDLLYLSNMGVYFRKNGSNYTIMLYS